MNDLIFDNRNKTARLESFQNFNNPQHVEMIDESNEYKRRKEAARAEAQIWQNSFADGSNSYTELYDSQNRFETLGKRYGLIKEFRENGII